MLKTFQSLALGSCLLAMTSVAMAQTADAPAVETPPAADAAAPNDLSMGVDPNNPGLPTQADAAVGSTYLAANFDKWEQRCVKAADGADPCQLYQLLLDKDGNSVAEISLFDLPAGGKAVAGASFMAPLETLLTANLTITVDTGTGPGLSLCLLHQGGLRCPDRLYRRGTCGLQKGRCRCSDHCAGRCPGQKR